MECLETFFVFDSRSLSRPVDTTCTLIFSQVQVGKLLRRSIKKSITMIIKPQAINEHSFQQSHSMTLRYVVFFFFLSAI